MWTYRQSTGELANADGEIIAVGYSGHGLGKDVPEEEEVSSVGPIPKGRYTIGSLHDEPGREGPEVMLLSPQPGTNVFNRGPFLIHGDSRMHPGEASLGCIIMPYNIRLIVGQSSDKTLEVIA
jgi:hypothetical protein